MKVFVQGLWHCGSVTAACLASLKHDVIAYDDNKKIISNFKRNILPIYEPNLSEMILESKKNKKISFTNNLRKLNSSNIVWFTYDTPVNDQDQGNTNHVITNIKKTLKKLNSNKSIIISSQLPVGTINSLEKYSKKILKKNFYFFCCPENLRLGNSISTFLKAERIIVGYRNSKSKKKIINFLRTINSNLIWMKIESAELTKHAINSFLASSISFINEISLICELTKADPKEVEQGLRSESRIGKKAFLSPGIPFAGGTLGRDLNYINEISEKEKLNTKLLASIKTSNENHKNWIFKSLKNLILNKKIKKVLIWGLAYTENTNTLRRSFAVELSKWLNNYNVKVVCWDKEIKKLPLNLKNIISLVPSSTSQIKSVDALLILGKSKDYLKIAAKTIKKKNRKLLIIDPNHFCKHFEKHFKNNYIGVGKNLFSIGLNDSDNKFDYNFKNQVTIITGASKGLGYEIAKNFLKFGSNIVICSRNLNEIKSVYYKLKKIKNKYQKILYFVTDVSSYDQVYKLINFTLRKFKKIDILINNAGIYGPKGMIEKISWDDWLKAIEINLFGSVHCCRAVIPHFKKRNTGKIIQLSGGGATAPLPMISAYAVSKAAIVRFIENTSKELKNYNIDLNAVAPGPLNTSMLEEILKAGPKKVGKEFYEKSLKQKKTGGTPFNEVCQLILFLASKHSNGISGKLISALWDDWKNWKYYKNILQDSDVYTLRRIAGRERGFEWGDK